MTCHSSNCFSVVWGQENASLVTSLPSLRGRRLKGKGKGVLGATEPKTPFPFPFKRLPRRLFSSEQLAAAT